MCNWGLMEKFAKAFENWGLNHLKKKSPKWTKTKLKEDMYSDLKKCLKLHGFLHRLQYNSIKYFIARICAKSTEMLLNFKVKWKEGISQC